MSKNTVLTTDIIPDISLMKKMASISGTIPSRLMELVDNSIDAKVDNKKLLVEINVVKKGSKQYIEIIDNGTGMSELAARDFFRLGGSKKEGKGKIGKFGLGSKVAILGLGNTCKVETTPVDESYGVDIEFDINKFKDWKINYEIIQNTKRSHGTKIKIENITIRIGNVKRFCQRLHENFGKAYKYHIENDEVEILVNGETVEAQKVELIDGLYKEFDFNLSSGRRVYGWAGAMKKAGTNWKFGFDLVKNNRVIKSNDFLTRQAHQSLSRLTGEIHLDDFETDVHKTDFARDTNDFQEMQVVLVENELSELISRIAKLTNREVFTKYQDDMQDVSKVLNRAITSYDFLNYVDIDDSIFKRGNRGTEKVLGKKKELELNGQEENIELVDGEDKTEPKEENENKKQSEKRNRRGMGLVIEEPIGVSIGSEQPAKRWLATDTENATRLTIEVNLDHPTYQLDDDESVSIYMKNAVVDSVAEFIINEEKNQQGLLEDEIERLNELKDALIRYSIKI